VVEMPLHEARRRMSISNAAELAVTFLLEHSVALDSPPLMATWWLAMNRDFEVGDSHWSS
jgi:hypothetical protein